ncbi:MAG: HEAT repeat domain-containing protein [Candidatus Heimdallarchaeota archaeon]|nr:HEAT repeat domain-containing protein [Candidatus Heimdallarchaeota archaeon]
MNNDIDLLQLQNAIIGSPKDLMSNSTEIENSFKQKSIRKIVELYTTCRANNRVYSSTYLALKDENPFVRVAAADLISKTGNANSFDYLFKALEDEDNRHVKQEIAQCINRLEARLTGLVYSEEYDDGVTLLDSLRKLTYTR